MRTPSEQSKLDHAALMAERVKELKDKIEAHRLSIWELQCNVNFDGPEREMGRFHDALNSARDYLQNAEYWLEDIEDKLAARNSATDAGSNP